MNVLVTEIVIHELSYLKKIPDSANPQLNNIIIMGKSSPVTSFKELIPKAKPDRVKSLP